jgi:hypothetical protein
MFAKEENIVNTKYQTGVGIMDGRNGTAKQKIATIRLQIELSEDMIQELDRMVMETDLSTRKDLFNNAMSLLRWALEEVNAGRSIASVDEENKRYKELAMPIFDTLRRRQRKR